MQLQEKEYCDIFGELPVESLSKHVINYYLSDRKLGSDANEKEMEEVVVLVGEKIKSVFSKDLITILALYLKKNELEMDEAQFKTYTQELPVCFESELKMLYFVLLKLDYSECMKSFRLKRCYRRNLRDYLE